MARARTMKKIRLLLSTMLGIMIFKLLIMRSHVQIVEEEEVASNVQEAVSFTLKPVEETPESAVNVAAVPPKSVESVEIIPGEVDADTVELDQVTKRCCRKHSDIPESCYGYCTFAKLNSQTIVELAVRSSSCKMSPTGIWNMMMCMSSAHDHTGCCVGKGVDKTDAGSLCLDFCTGRLQVEPMQNMGYLPCLGVWEPITECFKDFILEGSLIKMVEQNQALDGNDLA